LEAQRDKPVVDVLGFELLCTHTEFGIVLSGEITDLRLIILEISRIMELV
jgi:hypothetical protein